MRATRAFMREHLPNRSGFGMLVIGRRSWIEVAETVRLLVLIREQQEKRQYRTHNWRDHNSALARRGSLTLWGERAVVNK